MPTGTVSAQALGQLCPEGTALPPGAPLCLAWPWRPFSQLSFMLSAGRCGSGSPGGQIVTFKMWRLQGAEACCALVQTGHQCPPTPLQPGLSRAARQCCFLGPRKPSNTQLQEDGGLNFRSATGELQKVRQGISWATGIQRGAFSYLLY